MSKKSQTKKADSDISPRFLPVVEERKENLASSVDSSFYQSPDFSQFMTSSGPDNDDHTLESDLLTPLFFQKVYEEDPVKRRRAAENCISALSRNFYTPDFNLVRAHLSRVVELSVECPFSDTRFLFLNFLKEYQKEIEERNLKIPKYCDHVSYFFTSSSADHVEDIDTDIDTESEVIREVFVDSFLSTGRVSHLTRIMAWHPEFIYKYQVCNQYLMGNNDENDPLPTHIKHFVALMAVSRWKNAYLVGKEERFLIENGFSDWTTGFSHLPKKMNLLLEFNAKMAESCWKLTDADFSALVNGEDAWTVSEIIQIVIILATYRGLASFVSATGLNEELEYPTPDTPLKSSQGIRRPRIEVKNKMMMNKMKLNLTTNQFSPQGSESIGKQSTETDKLALFCAAAATDESGVLPQACNNSTNSVWTESLEKRYSTHCNITYSDFNFKDSKPLIIQEYNWSTNGYNEVANYYSQDMADILEDTFTFTMNFTYSYFNTEKSVDTTQFRLAVWNYTHRLLGIFHDDYDYELVNVWLYIPLKQYIKKIVCYPFTIVESDIDELGFLLPSERIHVALIVMEARRMAELICVLRLVSRHTQSGTINNSLSNSSSSGGQSAGNLSNSRSKKVDIFFRVH